jgi:hypothetical protein
MLPTSNQQRGAILCAADRRNPFAGSALPVFAARYREQECEPSSERAWLLYPSHAALRRFAEPGCVIKGNISSSGERIYHVPGQRYYDKTLINGLQGERWFCTEQEAIAAGWRKAKV